MPLRPSIALAALLALAGCSGQGQIKVPPPLPPAPRAAAAEAPDLGLPQTAQEQMPAPPASEPRRPPPPAAGLKGPPLPEKPGGFHLNFNQIPLTTLVQVVYADMLGRTVQIDAKVQERRDLVSFRTPPGQSAAQVEAAVQLLLRSFGIAVLDFGSMVRIVPDGPQSGMQPELRRGSALPETPERLRPVFQLVDLEAVRNTEVAGWLRTVMGTRVTVTEDATRNALLLSGTSDAVAAAVDVVRLLDQPVMRGRSSLRVTPVYWSAQELATTLNQVLTAEGYAMPPAGQPLQSGGVRYPIILLPVPATNSLFVFSTSNEITRHIQNWIGQLDQPNKRSAGRNFFTYTARNVSADSLARTLGQFMQGGPSAAAAPAAAAAGAPAAAGAAPAQRSAPRSMSDGSQVVVDGNSNSLIFNTSAENYSQLITLLNALDQPSKAALIEVTVAEVRLTDDFSFGVEWLLKESGVGSSTVVSTIGGLGLGTAGLTLTRIANSGDVRLVLNAMASSNRATILSSPRVLARNGETARIQVGQEVPIITSQQSTIDASTGNGAGVLQTVQYRNTGVILSVKPSIFSGDRIDLDVKQEVSAAQETKTGVNNSPTILTRNVDTKLTLENGSTVLLGGLIANDRAAGNTGIPWLRDIPLLGHLFRVDTEKTARTELVVLITPYVINDGTDARHYTDAFKSMLPLLEPQLAPPLPVAPKASEPAPGIKD